MTYNPIAQGAFVATLRKAFRKGFRRRWTDEDGIIYEWDSRHSELEGYDKRGHHLGAFDAETGLQIKPSVPGRRIEV